MSADLRGRRALVTGASRRAGIGAATARALADVGADIVFAYYRPYDATIPWGSDAGEVEGLLSELMRKGVRVHGLECDLADPTAPRQLFEEAEGLLGSVDILVNNAAYSERDGVSGLTAELLDRHYAVNVRATALLCAEFARRFEGSEGRIINLTSGQGLGPMPGELAYAATKGAVEALTLSLGAELAPRSITVNAVDPGPTDTGWMSPTLKARLEEAAPMGRVGTPEDAARLIRFLASKEAGWITGQVVRSRGGL